MFHRILAETGLLGCCFVFEDVHVSVPDNGLMRTRGCASVRARNANAPTARSRGFFPATAPVNVPCMWALVRPVQQRLQGLFPCVIGNAITLDGQFSSNHRTLSCFPVNQRSSTASTATSETAGREQSPCEAVSRVHCSSWMLDPWKTQGSRSGGAGAASSLCLGEDGGRWIRGKADSCR